MIGVISAFGVLSILAVVAVILAGLTLVDWIPPRALTHTHMHVMKRRILRYAASHDALPTSLEQLPYFDGFDNSVTDGWRRPILWKVEGDQVTLTSYGRDRTPGGFGEDADMVGVFGARTPNGRWADELCEWQIDPFGPRK